MKHIYWILSKIDFRFWIVALILALSTAFTLYYNYKQSQL
jgi:hypothetical protein